MGLFENIHQFEEVFFSIRKHDGYFILDLKFPSHWDYSNYYNKEKIGVKVSKATSEGTVVSFYCADNSEGVKFLEKEILHIIKINRDKEEKSRLLEVKTKELEELFHTTNLEELKNFTFTSKTPNININGTSKQTNGLVGEGNEERPQGIPDPQEKGN